MSLRKPKWLTLHEKSFVIRELNDGKKVTYLARKYGVAKSTICKIKQKKELISCAVRDTYVGPCKRQTLKSSKFPKMEKTLYEWFLDQRDKHFFVSGEMIKEKAKFIHSQTTGTDKQFTASEGWLQRFKKRFGIRFQKFIGEKFEESDTVKSEQFENIVKEEVIEECQTDEALEEKFAEQLNRISLDSAINALNVATQWAEESDVDISDLIILKRLREKAIMQKIKNSPKETEI